MKRHLINKDILYFKEKLEYGVLCDICDKKLAKFLCGECGKRLYCSYTCKLKDYIIHFFTCDLELID